MRFHQHPMPRYGRGNRLGQNEAAMQPSQGNVQETIKDFYIYETQYDSLANGTSQSDNFTVEADSDFMLHKLAYFADIGGAAQTDNTAVIPLATALITDTGSGRQLSAGAIPIKSYFGSGRLPFILPAPKLFLARSVVQVQVENFSASTTYNIKLAFIGYKIFRLS